MRHALDGLVHGFKATDLFGAADDDDPDDEGDPSQEEAASGDDGDGEEDPVTFSQEDMSKVRDEAAKHRVAKQANAKELEETKARVKELEQKEMDELERAKADLEESLKATSAAEARAIAAEASSASLQISTKVTLAAIKAGFNDPEDVLSMIPQDDLVDDEGEVSAQKIKAKVKSLADKKPYLLKQPGAGSGDGGPTGRPEDEESFDGKVAAHTKVMLESGGRVPR